MSNFQEIPIPIVPTKRPIALHLSDRTKEILDHIKQRTNMIHDEILFLALSNLDKAITKQPKVRRGR